MKNYKYSIDLVLNDGCNMELAASEFSRGLEFPRKMFAENLQFMTFRYNENEKELALKHCHLLNLEIQKFGFKQVEFKIKEHKILVIPASNL